MQHLSNLSDLGQEVARLRRDKGLTQKELGALCGLAQSTLARFEKGNVSEFGSRKLLRLLEVLGYGLTVSAAKPRFTLDDALAVAEKDSLERGTDEIMIIGGAGIFNELLPRADRMYLTVIHGTFSGDTFFPGFDSTQWQITRSETTPADDKNTHSMTLYVLDRTTEKPLTVHPHQNPAKLPAILTQTP